MIGNSLLKITYDIEDIKVWFRSKFVEPYDEIVGQIFIDHWGSI